MDEDIDAIGSRWEDALAWRYALEEALADDERHP